MMPGSQQAETETDETDETGASPSHVSKLLQMVLLKFNKDSKFIGIETPKCSGWNSPVGS